MPLGLKSSLIRQSSVLAGLAWLPLGMMLALCAPTLNMSVAGVRMLSQIVPLLITGALIAWNLVEAIRVVGRNGRTLTAWPMTSTQLALFALLFYQISCHLGAEHFQMKHPPQWWDWLLFTGAHVLRAGDMLDFIEAYGLNLQSIHHSSQLTAVLLMAMHFIFDLFVLRLVMDVVDRIKKRLFSNVSNAIKIGIAASVVSLFVVIWLLSALWFRPWKAADIPLWLLDNVVRVIDFVDAMELLHVRLHNVSKTFWEGTLTFVCRMLIGLGLNELLSRASRWLSLRAMNGFGLTPAQLEEACLKKSGLSDKLRRTARTRLKQVQSLQNEEAPNPTPAFVLAGAAVAISLALAFAWPDWSGSANHLTDAALQPGDSRRDRAFAALRCMGPCAFSATPRLVEAATAGSPQDRETIVQTLNYMGPDAHKALASMAANARPEVALIAVRALDQRGDDTAPLLIDGLHSTHEEVRRASRAAIVGKGNASLRSLLDTLTPENVDVYVSLLDEIDPNYWHLYPTDNPHAQTARQLHDPMKALRRKALTREEAQAANLQLAKLGPMARPAIPLLIDKVSDYDQAIAVGASDALRQILVADPMLIPDFNELLAPNVPILLRIHVAQQLAEIGPKANMCVPSLIEALATDQRQPFRNALACVGMPQSSAAPKVIALIGSSDAEVRQTAAAVLNRIDQNWRARPEALAAVGALSDQLAAKETSQRIGAAGGLETLGPTARPAVSKLVAVITDPARSDSVAAAVAALEKIDSQWSQLPAVQTVLPNIVMQLARNPSDPVNQQILKRLSPNAGSTVKAILPVLRDSRPATRIAACVAIGAMGSSAQEAVPELVKILQDESAEARKAACDALGAIGPAAKEAVPLLLRALVRADESVKDEQIWIEVAPSAKLALDKIDSQWFASPEASAIAPGIVDRLYFSFHKDLSRELVSQMASQCGEIVVDVLNRTADSKDSDREAERILAKLKTVPMSAIAPLFAVVPFLEEKLQATATRLLDQADRDWRQSTHLERGMELMALRIAKEPWKEHWAYDRHLFKVKLDQCIAMMMQYTRFGKKASPILQDAMVRSMLDSKGSIGGLDLGQAFFHFEKVQTGLRQVAALLSLIDPDWRKSPSATAAARAIGDFVGTARFPDDELPFFVMGLLGPAAQPYESILAGYLKGAVRSAAIFPYLSSAADQDKALSYARKTLGPHFTAARVARDYARALGDSRISKKEALADLAVLINYNLVDDNKFDPRVGVGSVHVRIAAVQALGRLGPAAKAVLPQLLLRNEQSILNSDEKEALLEAIKSVGKGN
jgi:HEAT repeat protein